MLPNEVQIQAGGTALRGGGYLYLDAYGNIYLSGDRPFTRIDYLSGKKSTPTDYLYGVEKILDIDYDSFYIANGAIEEYYIAPFNDDQDFNFTASSGPLAYPFRSPLVHPLSVCAIAHFWLSCGQILEAYMRLSDYLDPALVICDLQVKDHRELLSRIAERICQHHPDLDKKTLSDKLQEREEKSSSGLEGGVAVPHAMVPGVEKAIWTRLGAKP